MYTLDQLRGTVEKAKNLEKDLIVTRWLMLNMVKDLQGEYSMTELARQLGVSRPNLYYLLYGKDGKNGRIESGPTT